MNHILEHFDCEITNFDAHIHTPWIKNFEDFKNSQLKTYGVSVTPEEYENSHCLALGLHPWYARTADVEIFARHCKNTRYIGEIGLDSLRGCEDQQEIFEAICHAIRPQSYVSIHSVKSMPGIIDTLRYTGRLDDCCLIFHWFSEDSQSLKILRNAGCYFSINSKMLKTKKGQEYVKAIEIDHLLLETDLPAYKGIELMPGIILNELASTYNKILELKGCDYRHGKYFTK